MIRGVLMNFKNKLSLCLSVITLFVPLNAKVSYAVSYKDVSDPVLQEIISSFTTKVPRFINKHGNNLFVEDEPVTRGSFISALYEYDKSIKSSKADSAPKTDLDAIKLRLTAVEGKMIDLNKEPPKTEPAAAKLDIAQIINDLKPNMPFLLDGTLNSSKVFSELKNKVMSELSAGEVPVTKGTGVDKSSLDALNQKIQQMELSLTDLRSKAARTQISDTQAAKPDLDMLNRLKRIEVAVANLRQNDLSPKPDSDNTGIINRLSERMALLEKNAVNTIGVKSAQNSSEAVLKNDIDNISSRLGMLERNLLAVSDKLDTQGEAADRAAKNDFSDLKSRIDKLETASGPRSTVPQQQAASAGPSKKELLDINTRLSIIEKDMYVNSQKQIEDILRRIDKIESSELIGYKDSPKDSQVSVKNLVSKSDVEELESRIAFLEKDVYVNLKDSIKDTKDKMQDILKDIRAIRIDLEKR
jgi:hypothetical protein